MPTFETQGLTAHYTDHGTGPDVVLLHAGGSSSRQWRKMSGLLGDRYRLLAPDLIGLGETPNLPPGEPMSHDHQARLAADLIDHAAGGRAHVVGHSFGGASALRLAITSPERINRLVLIEAIVTPLLQHAGEDGLYGELEKIAWLFCDAATQQDKDAAWRLFIDYRNSTGTWDGLKESTRERFLAQTREVAEGFRANLQNPTRPQDLSRLDLPVLILRGEKTTEPDIRIAEILRDHIPGCNYELLPGAEHMSPLTHPEAVAKAVDAFLGASGSVNHG